MTDQSSQQALRESLSALVDDQASELEIRRVLRASEEDNGVRETWTRYQLARSAMRGEVENASYIDLSASIRDAIDQEDSYEASDSSVQTKQGWAQRLGRFAIAASVAGVVVMTAQLAQSPTEVEVADTQFTPETVPSVVLPAGYGTDAGLSARTVSNHKRLEPSQGARFLPQVAMPQTMTKSQQAQLPVPNAIQSRSAGASRLPGPEVQLHLQRVMEVHAGHAALNSGKGMLPYARVPLMVEKNAPTPAASDVR